jgi:hypothetical protein
MAYESADEKAVLLNPRRYVMGRPTTSVGKAPVEKKAAVLLRKLAAAGEKNGPHSFQITSPYKNEAGFCGLNATDPPPRRLIGWNV